MRSNTSPLGGIYALNTHGGYTMKHSFLRKYIFPLLTACLVLLLIRSDIVKPADRYVQDSLFQQPGVPSGDIKIIEIDERSLSELGPYGPSYRGYMAYALQRLAADPDNLPAVVAIDILYEGTSDPAMDNQLARAAASLPRVVTSCMAQFGDKITWEDGRATNLEASAINIVEPFSALENATTQGHINAMQDKDGILRHALLYVENPENGEKILSMACQTARLFQESKGEEFSLPYINTAGHYYVPFVGKPRTFDEGLSFVELIRGSYDPALWKDKIVLIGPYAAALNDYYMTAADKATPMYGIEYQANVIQSLFDHNLKSEASEAFQFVLVAILCVCAAFLFFRLPIRFGGIICVSLLVVSFLGAFLFWNAGLVVHVLWLPVAILLVYLAALISHYIMASRERRALALEKERVSTELALATRIQSNFLPKTFPPFPDRHEFDLYASMTPAREVGGDLYDFFLIDDDHLCLVIGDVSGKGVPASLFMMLSSALIHHVAMHELSPAKILTEVNAEICNRNPEEMFVTVWLGILEISTGILTAASAGHEYPTLRMPNADFELIKDKHGFVLGGMPGIRYREYTLNLEPGSRLFVYTDGVPEATDANQQMFGTDRMVQALNTAKDKDPGAILETVKNSVSSFVGNAEQFDDLTMLCLEYKGTKQ